MQNLKHATENLFTKQKQSHRHREQIYGCQGGEGADTLIEINIDTVWYIKHSTWNYTQCLMTAIHGEDCKYV